MERIVSALKDAIKDVFNLDIEPEVTRPDEQFGDYATNVALKLAGSLKITPREVAERLSDKIKEDMGESVREVSIAGPGFINIRLTDQDLFNTAFSVLEGQPKPNDQKTVLVEYSDPNPFKPLHAGHLYTTLVGDCIARMLERSGAHMVRINYGGDVGLHVGKSMWSIIKYLGGEHPEKLSDVDIVDRPKWLGARYVEGNTAYESDEVSKDEIVAVNKKVYDVQAQGDHETPFAQIYWTCRQWSYDYFAEMYKQLQVVPFDRFIPESEVTNLGLKTVREQLEKGVFTESDGAVVFKGEAFGFHTRVFINSSGLPTYETKDVGLSLQKWNDYHFDQSIIITANEQSQYMNVVIAAIRQFAPEPASRTTHLTHGMVKLQGGVKISSRKGNGPSALDILAAAREAGDETGTNPTEETILAAVKYAFAKNRVGGDIIYDPKESIALEGNSGPYLQYAHARARSILEKAGKSQEEVVKSMLESGERSLLRKISEYPEVLQLAMKELTPHHICTYLYELAQVFNRFYEHNRVIGDERQALRVEMVRVYATVLADGLGLLGIAAPDHL